MTSMEHSSAQNEFLIKSFLQRDRKVITTFYQTEWPKVKSMILGSGGTEENAKDIMQEALAALYTNIKKGTYINQAGVKITTYFLQLCKYRWYDLQKSAHHRKSVSIKESNAYGYQDDQQIEQDILTMERNRILHQMLDQMDQRCREILRSFYWEEQSLKEIASAYDLTEESAKNAKYRCLKRFKELVGKHKNVEF